MARKTRQKKLSNVVNRVNRIFKKIIKIWKKQIL